MSEGKPRIIKDFEKLDEDLQEQIKLAYPEGFYENLIHFNNKEGLRVSALPFETDDRYYLLRMTVSQAKQIIEDDDDFDDEGVLRENIKDDYQDKYGDMDHMADYLSEHEDEDKEGV